MRGKLCIVTGANSGIGKETARALLRQGARVVMFCRNARRAEVARAEIDAEGRAEVELCDLQSYASVRAAAERFLERNERLDVLVNNAGLYIPTRYTTVDGHEATWQTNHLGHFLLTNLLLDRLKATGSSRVVNVSSMGHHAGSVNFDDLFCERRRYIGMRVYCDTKLGNVLFTNELARRLEGTGVTANAVHPGVVGSDFGQREGGPFAGLMKVAGPLLLTPARGARTSIHVASSPVVEGVTGRYFARSRPTFTSRRAGSAEDARRLWELSEALTGVR